MKIFCDKKPTKPNECMFSYYNPETDKYMCKILSEDGEVCDLEVNNDCSCLEELAIDSKYEVRLNQVELYGKLIRDMPLSPLLDESRRKHAPHTLTQ